MRHLADSHALLWYAIDDPKLSKTAKSLMSDLANEILISPASYWEIAIKVSMRKLKLQQPYDDFVDACLNKYRFDVLPIDPKHTSALISLPFHHKDPFDRLLIAQAVIEQLPIIGNDAAMDAYGVTRLW